MESRGNEIWSWFRDFAYTTICLRERRRLVMNLRVRMVTGESAMIAKLDELSEKDSQSRDQLKGDRRAGLR